MANCEATGWVLYVGAVMIAILSPAEIREIIDTLQERIINLQNEHSSNELDEIHNQAVVVLLKSLIKKLTPVEDTI